MRYLPGYIKTPLYEAWSQMRKRCNNPSHNAYHNYGGRGITICPEWDDFAVFAADMGLHPGKGWSLEREKNDQNYCKANCRWATRAAQQRNTRSNKLTEAQAKQFRTGPVPALAKQFGVSPSLGYRIARGEVWIDGKAIYR